MKNIFFLASFMIHLNILPIIIRNIGTESKVAAIRWGNIKSRCSLLNPFNYTNSTEFTSQTDIIFIHFQGVANPIECGTYKLKEIGIDGYNIYLVPEE